MKFFKLTAVAVTAGQISAQVGFAQSAPTGTRVVSNMSDNTVTIIHAGSGRVWAALPTGEGPHEVGCSPIVRGR